MAHTPAVSYRSPVRNLHRPEPRLASALLHADDRVLSWLGRLYTGRPGLPDQPERATHGLEAPFEHDSAHLNPHDVLVAFIHAAKAGQERNFEALDAGAPRYHLAG